MPFNRQTPLTDSAIRGSAPELLYDDKKKWQKDGPGNIILRVCFMQEPPPTTSPEAISEEMGEWSNYCGVKFKKADYPDKSDIRISFEKGLMSYTTMPMLDCIIYHDLSHF